MTHPNEELVRRFYKAAEAQEFEAVLGTLADDIVWHALPGSPLGGTYRGKDEVTQLFQRTQELTGGTFTVELHDALANDEHAVALVRARGERAGKTLDEPVVHVFHIAEGKLSEFWVHPHDAAKAIEFFG
jgi:uncharacterized protein